MGYYSPKVIAILIGMIGMGAGRTVAVKFFFQLGFDKPIFVTVLYMFAQGLALIAYQFTSAAKKRRIQAREKRKIKRQHKLDEQNRQQQQQQEDEARQLQLQEQRRTSSSGENDEGYNHHGENNNNNKVKVTFVDDLTRMAQNGIHKIDTIFKPAIDKFDDIVQPKWKQKVLEEQERRRLKAERKKERQEKREMKRIRKEKKEFERHKLEQEYQRQIHKESEHFVMKNLRHYGQDEEAAIASTEEEEAKTSTDDTENDFEITASTSQQPLQLDQHNNYNNGVSNNQYYNNNNKEDNLVKINASTISLTGEVQELKRKSSIKSVSSVGSNGSSRSGSIRSNRSVKIDEKLNTTFNYDNYDFDDYYFYGEIETGDIATDDRRITTISEEDLGGGGGGGDATATANNIATITTPESSPVQNPKSRKLMKAPAAPAESSPLCSPFASPIRSSFAVAPGFVSPAARKSTTLEDIVRDLPGVPLVALKQSMGKDRLSPSPRKLPPRSEMLSPDKSVRSLGRRLSDSAHSVNSQEIESAIRQAMMSHGHMSLMLADLDSSSSSSDSSGSSSDDDNDRDANDKGKQRKKKSPKNKQQRLPGGEDGHSDMTKRKRSLIVIDNMPAIRPLARKASKQVASFASKSKSFVSSVYQGYKRGSVAGVTREMVEQGKRYVKSTDSIPYHLKPAIPGFFNLANAACRWTALELIDASLLVMLIGGFDLILSVLAARYIRKRAVSNNRWIAVSILVCGVTLVGWAGLWKDRVAEKEDSEEEESVSGSLDEKSGASQFVGFVLVLCQSIMAVLQGLSEEVFTQDGNFPPLLLLGLEGLYGTIWGLMIYAPLTARGVLDEGRFIETLADLYNDPILSWFSIGLIALVAITGIFNIYSTAETSAMTRNLWKNMRAVLVWTIGLTAFYTSGNETIGEDWVSPFSFIVLLGFAIMLLGIYVYYTDSDNIFAQWCNARSNGKDNDAGSKSDGNGDRNAGNGAPVVAGSQSHYSVGTITSVNTAFDADLRALERGRLRRSKRQDDDDSVEILKTIPLNDAGGDENSKKPIVHPHERHADESEGASFITQPHHGSSRSSPRNSQQSQQRLSSTSDRARSARRRVLERDRSSRRSLTDPRDVWTEEGSTLEMI